MALRLPWRVDRWRQRAAFWRAGFLAAPDVIEVAGGDETATLIAAGDIDPSGAIESCPPESVLDPLQAILADADLRIANLEAMLTTRTEKNGSLGKFLRSDPRSVELLARGGFDAVTVANNHCLDHGGAGLLECLDVLDANGLAACGGGADQGAARRPARLEARGIAIGILGYCDDCRADPAAVTEPGPAPAIEEFILADIAALRAQVDLVVVQLHLGYEFRLHPLRHDRDLARRIADAGADLVLCHHAHVPMGLERRGRSLIAHGLSNLVRPPSNYIHDGHTLSDHSFLLRVGLNREGVARARIIPTKIDGLVAHPLQGGERARLLGTLHLCSQRLDDDRRLDALWHDRLIREAYEVSGHIDSPELPRFLRAPRQARFVHALCGHENDAARDLGDLLRAVADGAPPAPGARRLARAFATTAGRAPLPPGTIP